MSAGLDTTFANNAYGPFLGSALAQSFWADDTVITALTVWRPAGNLSVVGMTIYITGADSLGQPIYYLLYRRGPTLRVYDSDPPGGLIEMRFVFSPPVVLPSPGECAFFLQPEDCWPGEAWRVLIDRGNDDYKKGSYWATSRSLGSCDLRPAAGGGGYDDIVFSVEYCRDQTTFVRKSSWGKLMKKYRRAE